MLECAAVTLLSESESESLVVDIYPLANSHSIMQAQLNSPPPASTVQLNQRNISSLDNNYRRQSREQQTFQQTDPPSII